MYPRQTQIAWLMCIFLLAPLLASCGPDTATDKVIEPTITASPVDSPSSALPCASANVQPSQEVSTPQTGQTTPAASLSYDEIVAEYERAKSVLSQTPYDASRSRKAWDELKRYLGTLPGKAFSDWPGWIVSVGTGHVPAEGEITFRTSGLQEGPDSLLITMSDPFEAQVSSGTSIPRQLNDIDTTLRPPEVLIVQTMSANSTSLCIGDKVTFSGIITEGPQPLLSERIGVAEAMVDAVVRKAPESQVAKDLSDLIVRFDRSMCFGFCPAYSATLYGDGTIVFNGIAHTRVLGYKIGSSEEHKIRELLLELENANFYSEKSYTSYLVTDMPSAGISVSFQGKIHSVNHYYGDKNAPKSIFELEAKIDELLNTEQWVQ